MKSMTTYIRRPGIAKSLSTLLLEEINANARDVCNYTNDWQPNDIETIRQKLEKESKNIVKTEELGKWLDSVKGEEAMRVVYPHAGLNKATDVITLKNISDMLTLIEAKYLIKFACTGPFGGCGSFKARVSGKFLEMENQMMPDEENIDSLRILVVSEEQYPFSVNHIRTLMGENNPPGSFSDDGKTHTYVLCSSSNLRKLLDNPLIAKTNVNSFLFFSI